MVIAESTFYNRAVEREQLNNLGTRGKRDFAVIYGRRRCGKSTLLQKVFKNGDIYHLVLESTATLQRKEFALALEEKFPDFASADYENWLAFFNSLKRRVTEPFTLFIDEFPYLVKEDSYLPGVFQRLIDLKEMPFDLVLCGSSQQMMRGLIDYTAPLYGRADEIIKITPLRPGWISDHFPNLDAAACVEEFACWGGVPRYWELRARYETREEALQALLFNPTGLLYDEPQRLLLDDLRDLAQPITILNVIANGANRFSEIGGRVGKPAADLYRPTNKLIELGYVSKEVPYNESYRKNKKTLYRLSDPFLRLYYRFVAPNASKIARGMTEDDLADIFTPFAGFVSKTWEELCVLGLATGASGQRFIDANRWWGNNSDGKSMELDVVGRSLDKKSILVAECKWSHVTNEASLRQELERKARLLPFYNGEEIVSVIAAKSFEGASTGLTVTPTEVLAALKY